MDYGPKQADQSNISLVVQERRDSPEYRYRKARRRMLGPKPGTTARLIASDDAFCGPSAAKAFTESEFCSGFYAQLRHSADNGKDRKWFNTWSWQLKDEFGHNITLYDETYEYVDQLFWEELQDCKSCYSAHECFADFRTLAEMAKSADKNLVVELITNPLDLEHYETLVREFSQAYTDVLFDMSLEEEVGHHTDSVARPRWATDRIIFITSNPTELMALANQFPEHFLFFWPESDVDLDQLGINCISWDIDGLLFDRQTFHERRKEIDKVKEDAGVLIGIHDFDVHSFTPEELIGVDFVQCLLHGDNRTNPYDCAKTLEHSIFRHESVDPEAHRLLEEERIEVYQVDRVDWDTAASQIRL